MKLIVGTKFQFKLIILLFWTKSVQKRYFESQTKKSELYYWILCIGTNLANCDFSLMVNLWGEI